MVRIGLAALTGFLLGVAALAGFRLARDRGPGTTHYHANFALFVNGQRVDLRAPRFMEDVSKCKADPTQQDAADRVHLHNGDQDVVHVHAPAATWAHLFANLHMALGDRWLVTDQGVLLDGRGGGTLKFVLNGQEVPGAPERTIRSEDRLLVSYGKESFTNVLQSQYPLVNSNAGEFNLRQDPGSCGAQHADSWPARLRRALALD